jgi:hypothetical protein
MQELESIEYNFAGAFLGKKPFIKTPQFYQKPISNIIINFLIFLVLFLSYQS